MHRIEVTDWSEAPVDLRQLRQQVFITEQGVPAELEWDHQDDAAEHFLMRDEQGRALACARLYRKDSHTGGIGRMAVAADHRGKGLGMALLQHLLQHGANYYECFQLSAQAQATGFYQRAGFFITSPAYDDAGMPHHDMLCSAPLQVLSHPPAKTPLMTLGQDSTTWPLANPADLRAMTRTMAWQVRRRFWLYDELLDHDRYDDSLLAERLSALARSSRRADVRLLIHDDQPLIRRHHRLVRLLHRLPSRIQLRLVNTSYPYSDAPFILGDDQGVVYRHEFTRHPGFVNLAAQVRVRRLAEEYERIWQTARTSLELRQLPL